MNAEHCFVSELSFTQMWTNDVMFDCWYLAYWQLRNGLQPLEFGQLHQQLQLHGCLRDAQILLWQQFEETNRWVTGQGNHSKEKCQRFCQCSGSEAVAANLYKFDQKEFFPTPASVSMAAEGFIYIPTQCQDPTRLCKLHISFHGCKQGRWECIAFINVTHGNRKLQGRYLQSQNFQLHPRIFSNEIVTSNVCRSGTVTWSRTLTRCTLVTWK